ncbi:MAG: hypothetical protein KDD66_18010, partial [Bdellovibrionales bacterium]|nr:hypothetical protein [Bdellovibrionales bacterium]
FPEVPAAEGLSDDEARILHAVKQAKDRWERYKLIKPFVPEAFAAKKALEAAAGNHRIAAARLGTGVEQLRAALYGRVAAETNGTGSAR